MYSKDKKVIIFGNGLIAEVAYYCLKNDSEYDVIAFTADKNFCNSENFNGLPLIPFENVENIYPASEYYIFIPISYSGLNKIREEKYLEAKKKGYKFISYVSSKAICDSLDIGENCFILELNNIQPGVKIKNNVILWSGNHIGHHSTIEDNCFIASHAVISGSVTLGKNSFVGVNATIRDNITIGKESIIGAGSLLLKNVPDFSVISPKSTEISKIPSYKLKKI